MMRLSEDDYESPVVRFNGQSLKTFYARELRLVRRRRLIRLCLFAIWCAVLVTAIAWMAYHR